MSAIALLAVDKLSSILSVIASRQSFAYMTKTESKVRCDYIAIRLKCFHQVSAQHSDIRL